MPKPGAYKLINIGEVQVNTSTVVLRRTNHQKRRDVTGLMEGLMEVFSSPSGSMIVAILSLVILVVL